MLNYLIITGLPSLLKSDRIVCNYSVKTWYSEIQPNLCQIETTAVPNCLMISNKRHNIIMCEVSQFYDYNYILSKL